VVNKGVEIKISALIAPCPQVNYYLWLVINQHRIITVSILFNYA
jgi:hypothetical protein